MDVWVDVVIPVASVVTTTATAVVAIAISIGANSAAKDATAMQEKLWRESVERDERLRRTEVAGAMALWFESAYPLAIEGMWWDEHQVATERAARLDTLISSLGDRDIELYKSGLSADVMRMHGRVVLTGHKATGDELRALGEVSTQLRLWVADPQAFLSDQSVRERIESTRESTKLLGYE